jgi:hypothetical protein
MTRRLASAACAVAIVATLIGGSVPAAAAGAAAPTVVMPPEPVTVVPAARVPDRVDRRWPAEPPWDACPRPVWPGTVSSGSPGEGRRVLIVGDSLTRESRELSTRLMHRSGWTPTFRCWGSKRLDWGLDQVARARDLRQLPQVVILALGTNDISWETPQTTERRVRQLIRELGPRRQVLWVDLHLTRSAWLDARADWFNDLLHRLARTHRNLTVVSWHAMARAHGIRGWDGIHYGPSGYRLRAHTVLAALNEVGRRHPVAVPDRPGPTPTSVPTPTTGPTAPPTPAPPSGPTASASTPVATTAATPSPAAVPTARG